MTIRVVTLIAACATVAAPAAAQDQPTPRPHRITVSAGLTWLAGSSIGDRTADLRRNVTGATSPPPFTLFEAESSLEPARAADVRVGFALTPTVVVELATGYSRPRLAVAVSQDAEADPITLDDERISQYVVDALVSWQFPRLRIGSRARPYVLGGIGYLRQLHEGRRRADVGQMYQVGGGVRVWLRGGDGDRRAVGMRSEIAMKVRRGGIVFDDRVKAFPAVNVLAFVGF